MIGEGVFARGYFELRNGMDLYSICDLAFFYDSTAAKYQYLTNLRKLNIMQGDKVACEYTIDVCGFRPRVKAK